MILEKQLESKFVSFVRMNGGIALKMDAMTCAGIPDRIVLLPDGKVVFVEFKQEGQKPRPLQRLRHDKLRSLGFNVFVIDRESQFGDVL